MSIASNYTDLLLKKYLGVVETSTTNKFSSEAAGNARPMLFTNQLYNYPIKSIAPEGPSNLNTPYKTIQLVNSNPDLVQVGYVNSSGRVTKTVNTAISYTIGGQTVQIIPGVVYASTEYPWIQYIQNLPLSSIGLTQGTSYRFADPTSAFNILQNAIPFNYDPAKGSYTHFLYTGNGSSYNGIDSLINQSNYIVDCDAGYLMFINADYNESSYGAKPLISFYRYNGAIGIPTNLGNFAGAYAQDPTAIAIGNNAGYTGQGANALAIGNFAGAGGQGTGSIAIGLQAGFTGQGANSIAIGAFAGPTGLTANSIVLNASGTGLAGTGPTGGFYVAPVASYSGSTGPFMLLAYGADKQIVCVTGAALTAMNISSSAGGGGGGSSNPNPQLITLGQNAGTGGAVNIGFNAGQFTQGTGSIAIGYNAGPTGQGGVTGMSYNTSWVASTATGSNIMFSAMSSNGQYQIAPVSTTPGSYYYTSNGNMANPTWLSASVPSSVDRIVLIADNKAAIMMNDSYGYVSDFTMGGFSSIPFSSTNGLNTGFIVAAKASSDFKTILAASYTGSPRAAYYLYTSSTALAGTPGVSGIPAFINITSQLTSTPITNLVINNGTIIGMSKDGNVCITSLSTTTGSSLYFTSILKLSTATTISLSSGYTAASIGVSPNTVNTITLTTANPSIKVGMYVSYMVNSTTVGLNVPIVTNVGADNKTITISANVMNVSTQPYSITFRTFTLLDNVAPLLNYSAVNTSTSQWKVVAISRGNIGITKYYMLVGGKNTFVYRGIYDTATNNNNLYLPTFTKTSLPQANWQSYAISATGQYMYALTSTGMIYYSDSYGDSWTSYAGPSGPSYTTDYGILSLSDDGMYGLMTNYSTLNPIYNFNTVYTNTTGNALALGTSAGQTNQGAGSVAIGSAAGQTERALSYGSFATANWIKAVSDTNLNINRVTCSASGQIQIYGRSITLYPSISRDSGQTFNLLVSSLDNPPTTGNFIIVPDLPSVAANIYAVSADGNTIVIVTSSNATAYISPNTGASFPIRYTCGTGSETALAVAVSGQGQYIVIITSLGIYFSNDFGRSFTNIHLGSSISTGASCAISYTGQYILIFINGTYYTLNNYGILPYSIYLPFESSIAEDGINVTTNVGVIINSSIKKIGTYSAAFGSNKYLVIPMDSAATSFTLCCWVYYNTLNPSTGAGVIFSLYNTVDIDTQSLADVFLSGSTIYSNINKFGTISGGNITGPSIAAATWYHVALTFNYNAGSNGTYIVYVNGAIAGQRTTGLLSTGYYFPNQLYMGRTSTANNNQFIDGYVDDFRYYKSILNASQIATIYGLASSSALPIYGLPNLSSTNLYFPFESISGTTNIDGIIVTTNANTSVQNSDNTKKIGNNYLAFNGTSSYIITPVNYNIVLGFTICCWVNFSSLKRQFIWCLSGGYSNTYGAFVYCFLGDNNNTINFIYNGSTIRSVTYTIPGLATGTWYHFSASFNQNGVSTLYVNGVSVGTFTATDSSFGAWAGTVFPSTYPNEVLVIGANSWTGELINGNPPNPPTFFGGFIDDFRHYGTVLTASQITTIYNTTATSVSNSLALSPSGQYQVYTNIGIGYLSTNFGASYSALVTPTSINSIVISQNGQMLAYNDGTAIYYSSNMGASWFTINPTSSTPLSFVSLAMSADGSYFITASANAVYTLNENSAGNSIAIGTSAGQINQAVNTIAIGNAAGQTNQPANTIIMNASGTPLNATVTNGCFIAPIATQANSTSTFFNLLMYGSDNQVVQTSNLKMDANGSFSGCITSTITIESSQFRLLSAYNNNKYGVLLRYDGWAFYMLRTNANNPYGGWSNDPSGSIDRPFKWELETGKITFGAGITCCVSSTLADSISFPALSLTNISGFNTKSIDFYPHINLGGFNSIVESGDFAIINKDQSSTAGISIATWETSAKLTAGLRIGKTSIKTISTDILRIYRVIDGFTTNYGSGISFYGGSTYGAALNYGDFYMIKQRDSDSTGDFIVMLNNGSGVINEKFRVKGNSVYGTVSTVGSGWSGYSINNRFHLMAYHYDNLASNGEFGLYNSDDNRWYIYCTGNRTCLNHNGGQVIIGGITPQGSSDPKVEIQGGLFVAGYIPNSIARAYGTFIGNTTGIQNYIYGNMYLDSFPFGIYSYYTIATNNLLISASNITYSDVRIKKNIQTQIGLLDKIDKLRVVSYDHIDSTKESVYTGVIAQEIASIIPKIISRHSEVIPNIFTIATTHTKLENTMIHIIVDYKQSVDIIEGSTVRLIIEKTGNEQEITYDNTIVNLTLTSFDIKAWEKYDPTDKVFVYGTKVQNFLCIDKQQLGLIALGGVKELYQQVKVLQSPDITIGNRTDPTIGSFKITYDADKSSLVMGSSINGFVNKQFLMHQNAPSNSLSITADGTVYNNGTLVSSDKRIKTDIEPISDEECLLKINRLNVVKYNYTNPSLNGANKVIGFIAQEVREAIPEAVDITTKNIYWSNTFNFTVGQANTVVDSTYTSLSDKNGKTYTITNGVVYDASNTAVFYFKDNILVSVYSTPTRDEDGKLLYSISKTYDLSKDDTYVLHTHSIYKQTDVMISVATVDVIVGNIVRFVYNSKKYEGIVMTVDSGVGAGASTLKVVTSDILVNGTLQTYEKVIQDFHMLSKEKIFALTVGAIQDLTTANTALKSQVGSLKSQVGSLQSQVGSLQLQLSTLMNWAKGQGFTDSSA